MGDRVRLLGHVDYLDLPSVYASADVFLQPSVSDTWGLAVNEAMACGLPVVVSNRCGCHEDLVETGGNGFTFDPFTTDGLIQALKHMRDVRSAWPSMGAASREIVSRWGLDRFSTNLWRASVTAASGWTGRSRARGLPRPHSSEGSGAAS